MHTLKCYCWICDIGTSMVVKLELNFLSLVTKGNSSVNSFVCSFSELCNSPILVI